ALLAVLSASPAQARYASIVMDFETGTVLHETNADTRNYPASLTKMMTLYLAFEALESGRWSLDHKLTVSRRAAGMAPSRLGLPAGAKIRVEDAILALVTKSANDIAVVIAESLDETESQFARTMTRKARALGMANTTFRNASGLPNRGQLSSARDMAILARALIREFPQYYDYFSTRNFTYKGRKYRNHNRLLGHYAGTDGIKTGYTRASGFNLAASVVRGGRRLIAVVFGGKTSRSRDRHIMSLLDKGFVKVAAIGFDKIPDPPGRKPAFVLAEAEPPPPRPERVPDLAEMGSAEEQVPETLYGVQVGAFYGYDRAKERAHHAASRLPEMLDDSLITITDIRGRRGRIYRSRLMGLSETAARDACAQLEAMKIDCLVVQMAPALAKNG
ncbi:MAG TPA: D-alanyl-D-alanine carboxypeptidase family protein, partial [Kiloniellales bacterium]|nr:D-alanyl-D-alanine carboxypeptidase family protein [Kiloniellales bacterium]